VITDEDVAVEPSGWFAVQLRYAYLAGDPEATTLVEDRVILVDGDDEEAALGRAVELAPEYEDDYETDAGERARSGSRGSSPSRSSTIRPGAGTEVWHEFMSPGPRPRPTRADGEPLPPVYPEEMAFPRAHDD
jgi:hypothetical protein